jgi:pantothenate kinase type III
MQAPPLAWIVSDFPISAQMLEALLSERFRVQRSSWRQSPAIDEGASLVVLDVTNVGADRAIAVLSELPVWTRVVVASLDRNEVGVYEVTSDGLTHRAEMPSLLDIAV